MRLRNFQSYFFHSQKHGSILTFIGYKQTDEESIFILSPPGGGGNIALTMYGNKTEIMFETIEKFHAHCLSCLCSLKLSQWRNLKNLSGGLNLSRGLNMVGST